MTRLNKYWLGDLGRKANGTLGAEYAQDTMHSASAPNTSSHSIALHHSEFTVNDSNAHRNFTFNHPFVRKPTYVRRNELIIFLILSLLLQSLWIDSLSVELMNSPAVLNLTKTFQRLL